jgi:simple sugar transport system substrate-binding protein
MGPGKIIGAAAAALAISVALPACSSQGTAGANPANSVAGPRVTIAMVTHGQSFDPFWGLVKKGAQTAARTFNVALKYSSPSVTNPQAQATLITQAARAKPAAMVVTIPDAAVLAAPVRQVTSSGTPVVVVNVGNDVYRAVGAITFVGQPDFVAGEEAGRTMAAAGVRKALCVIHEAKNIALTSRCAGFAKQLAASGGSVQVLHVNGAQLHQAQSAIEQTLTRNRGIKGVLATGIIGFEAAGGALQTLNEFGKVKFGTFDVSAADLTAVKNGQAQFVIDQQPFLEGYDAVQAAAFQVRYGQHPFQPIYTGPSLVTKANAAKVGQLYKNTGIPLFKGGYPQ